MYIILAAVGYSALDTSAEDDMSLIMGNRAMLMGKSVEKYCWSVSITKTINAQQDKKDPEDSELQKLGQQMDN